MVARSAIGDLGGEPLEDLGMRARIDLALEQPRGALDREPAHLAAQRLARARGLERDLLAGLREDALRLARGAAARLLDDLVAALAGRIDDLRGALARLAQDLLGVLLRLLEITGALRGGRQALGDLLLALLD